MERTIKDFCKDPKLVKSESCREILSKSNLNDSNKDKCTFYVVHTGSIDDFQGSDENEKVITKRSLEILYKNKEETVDREVIYVDNKMTYGSLTDNYGAIVCSINGFDLASLCIDYNNTEVGRNLLFGNNLRESLITKKSKPYLSMSQTIIDNPENFWYYNNGITIIAEDINEDDDNLVLHRFSIVNGAQTTSALGLFLKEAKKNQDEIAIEKLKKVYVLSRVLKVPDPKLRQDIAIFNNTQNPITSRDMVANRLEQKHLHEWLLSEGLPQIFAEIRRGSQPPQDFNKSYKHRMTTNEELAQLAYASFLQQPFTAKDKKSALFNNDYTQNDYVINKIYHDVFNWDVEDPAKNGIIFKKSKQEIDELLFVRWLYNEAKKTHKKALTDRIASFRDQKEKATTTEEKDNLDKRITTTSLYLDTVGICLFYFVSLYYEFRSQFRNDEPIRYDYDKIYSDKKFKDDVVMDVIGLFLQKTSQVLVNTAIKNGKAGNVNNWIRGAACQKAFSDELKSIIAMDLEIEEQYKKYCAKCENGPK